ncbi:hypothetical protein FQR65_LT20641 [Abscondita terminalis]|nr:hypothetical protein FQR65_LT20641 [Abscondita terminalis]
MPNLGHALANVRTHAPACWRHRPPRTLRSRRLAHGVVAGLTIARTLGQAPPNNCSRHMIQANTVTRSPGPTPPEFPWAMIMASSTAAQWSTAASAVGLAVFCARWSGPRRECRPGLSEDAPIPPPARCLVVQPAHDCADIQAAYDRVQTINWYQAPGHRTAPPCPRPAVPDVACTPGNATANRPQPKVSIRLAGGIQGCPGDSTDS